MWGVFVVLASIATAVYYFGNQTVKVSANVFMIYRGIVPVLLLLPFLPMVTFLPTWQFYVLCAVQGCVIAYIDNKNYQAMQKWGAEIVSSIHPLGIGAVFILWIILHPSDAVTFLQNLPKFCGVVIALSGIGYATSSFKNEPQSRQALKFLLPFLVGVAACDNLNKLCMSYVSEAQLITGSYFYILITGAVVAAINFCLYFRRNGKIKELYQPRKTLQCIFLMMLLMMSMVFKNMAMFNVSNPSYVTATLYLYIIWIMLGVSVAERFGIKGSYKRINRKKALLLLAATILLIMLEK